MGVPMRTSRTESVMHVQDGFRSVGQNHSMGNYFHQTGYSRRGQVVRPKLECCYLGNCGFYRKDSTDHFNENTGRIVRYVTCLTFKSANVCNCCEATTIWTVMNLRRAQLPPIR
jgi:hypothetical protein